MPVVLLGAAAVAVVMILMAKGHGARRYTKADGPALRELKLRRANLGRSWRVCMAKAAENNKSVLDVYVGSIAGAAGLVTGAVTLDPGKGVAVFRGIVKGYGSFSKDAPCQTEAGQAADDLRRIDELSMQLGLPSDISDDDLNVIWMSIGGDNFDAVTAQAVTTTTKGTKYVPSHSNTTVWTYTVNELDTWDRSVRIHGLASSLAGWDNGAKPPPPRDPVTGLALRK